jgi:hypothetical protein
MDKQKRVNGNAAKCQEKRERSRRAAKWRHRTLRASGWSLSIFLEIGSGPDSCRRVLPSFLILRRGQCLFGG